MTFEDPFFVVREEVAKALNKTRGLFRRWVELQEDLNFRGSSYSKDEHEWTTTELRNALRSIEWDLEDLEDTICLSIVEKNLSKFKIDNKELTTRRTFIEQTREEVKLMKERMNFSKLVRDKERTARQADSCSPGRSQTHGSTKYTRLENQPDSPNRLFVNSALNQQTHLMQQQDEQLNLISHSLGSLKTVSHQINSELDEQAVMLEDFSSEMENTESRLDSTMRKIAKALHMSNDRRQWMAIIALSFLLIVVIILLIILH